MKNKIERAEKTLQMINQWIANCDTKSSFILTFYGVMLTIIFTSKIGEGILDVFSFECATEWNKESVKNFFRLLFVFLFIGFVVKVFYEIFNTLIGRIDPKKSKEKGLDTQSKIFFGTISKRSFEDFETSSNKEIEEEYLKDLHSQIFINAHIVSKKFKHYNKSIKWLSISLIIFLIYIIDIINRVINIVCYLL